MEGYHTPTLRELLITIIDGEDLYAINKDKKLVRFRSHNTLSSLYGFIVMNDSFHNSESSIDFNIDVNKYLIKDK